MACSNCNQTSPVSIYDIQYLYSQNTCNSCNDPDCGSNYLNAKCVFYSGPNLTCSDIETSDNLETIIQKLDTQVCSITGDYSSFNMSCLAAEAVITTEQQFVEFISDYVCSIRTDLDEFINVDFPTYQADVQADFNSIINPGITCVSAGVISTDTLNTVLTKYCTKFSSLDSELDVSLVDWDQCFTVVTPPTTVSEGFDLLIDQICLVKATAEASATLPTFNNTTSCLPTPGAADSLVTTINKIKTKLCELPTLDNSALTSSCVSIPSTANDLEGLLQGVLDKIDTLSENMITFDAGDFSVVATDSGDPCLGKTVSLTTEPASDRYVAINVGDLSPGTLEDKLSAGTNITLDTTTVPGTMIINSSGSATDTKVKADSADANAAGYLSDKIEGGTSVSGITISTVFNSTTNKVSVVPTLNWGTFLDDFVAILQDNEELLLKFCNLIATCPSPCDAPSNVDVTYTPGTTTTTTTSSTTTTTTTV
jgi:hypothetical protein